MTADAGDPHRHTLPPCGRECRNHLHTKCRPSISSPPARAPAAESRESSASRWRRHSTTSTARESARVPPGLRRRRSTSLAVINFIVAPSLMTTEAAHLDVVAVVAVFAVAHLHAVSRSAPEAGHGMAPDIAAVAADAVLFVSSRLVRFPQGSVAVLCRPSRRDACGLHGRTRRWPAAANRPARVFRVTA